MNLYNLLKTFEDPVGLQRPLVRDISSNQGNYNMDIARQNGVKMIGIRAVIGWSYQDKLFPGNWANAEGMYRTSYHVLHPDLDVVKQADNWYRVNPEIDVIPRTMDVELNKFGLPSNQVADAVWEMSKLVLRRDGFRPWIYSRRLLLNDWLASWTADMLNMHYWWLAQYRFIRSLEHAGPPTLPDRVDRDRIILHQTADKKPGFPGEAESAAVDYDRWELGDEDDMDTFVQAEYGGGVEPPANPELVNALDDMQAVVDKYR